MIFAIIQASIESALFISSAMALDSQLIPTALSSTIVSPTSTISTYTGRKSPNGDSRWVHDSSKRPRNFYNPVSIVITIPKHQICDEDLSCDDTDDLQKASAKLRGMFSGTAHKCINQSFQPISLILSTWMTQTGKVYM